MESLTTKDSTGTERIFTLASNNDYIYLIVAIPQKRNYQEAIPIPKIHWDTFKQLINEQESK